MSETNSWRKRLQDAVRRLEQTKAAPGWLAAAVRESLGVADDLAPRATKDAAPDDFFYPH
jgi:hypothetical protein